MNYRALLLLLAGASLVACDSPRTSADLDLPLLQLHGEARDGKLYMLAPASDSVIEIDPATGDFSSIEVGREPTLLSRPPTSDELFTLERADSTLSRVAADGTVVATELGASFTTLSWSPDGTTAVAWIDPVSAASLEVDGSLNLNAFAVLRVDGATVEVTDASLTFQPLAVTWSADSSRALISTSARLHVLDVTVDPIAESAVPFSVDQSVHRRPERVVPGPSGDRALVTVENVADLFVLGLSPVLIENVIGLNRVPRDVVWSRDGSKAIIADGTNLVSFLDLQSFDLETLELPHTVSRILPSEGVGEPFALLYDEGGYTPFITRVDLTDSGTAPDDPEVFVLEDGVVRVEISPEETAAVIFHDGGSSTGEYVPAQSLSLFHFTERAPSRILLDAPAWDLVFLGAGVVDDDEQVMVVLKDSARLVRYNLRTYGQVVLDTYSLPHEIGRVPPGEGGSELLYVVHDHDVGLVSFVEPAASSEPSGGFPAVAGMALSDLLEGR